MTLEPERVLAEVLHLPELAFGTLAHLILFRTKVLEQAAATDNKEILAIDVSIQAAISADIGAERAEVVTLVGQMLNTKTVKEEITVKTDVKTGVRTEAKTEPGTKVSHP